MLIAIKLSDLLYYKLSRFNLYLLHSIHHGIKWSSLLDISGSFLCLFDSSIFWTQERTDPIGQTGIKRYPSTLAKPRWTTLKYGRNIGEMRYRNSIDALRQLLSTQTQIDQGVLHTHSSQPFCSITNSPKGIFYTKNGTEYYFVEITCKDNVQYKIQAFGEEALELCREVHKCISLKEQ